MRFIKLTALLTLFLLMLASCSSPQQDGGEQMISAAVLYFEDGSDSWRSCYSHLEQSLLANMTVKTVEVGEDIPDMSGYDVIYPDTSLLSVPDGRVLCDAVTAYTEAGGAVFLDNAFYDFFSPEFMGASSFVKLDSLPGELEISDQRQDFSGIQDIIGDFFTLYRGYIDFEHLSGLDYGYGMVCETATPLVSAEGKTLYAINKYGNGLVLFTNPLLPNAFSPNGFDMLPRDEPLSYFINSTASANQIIRNEFAALVSREKYGYSATRVFGAFGRPSISWELHYEEISGIANDSAITFNELCKKYSQIPSYTLVRNPMLWATRLESVTYLPNKSGGSALDYEMDAYENAYSSGLHVVSDGEFLSLERLENTVGGYIDNPDYDLRAYPYVADITGDGLPDMICGSSDGMFYFYSGTGDTKRFTVSAASTLTGPGGAALTVPAGYSAPVMYDADGDGISDLVSGCANGLLYWFKCTGSLSFTPMGVLLNPGFGRTQILPDACDLDGDGIMELLIGTGNGRLAIFKDAVMTADLTGSVSELGHFISPRAASLNGDRFMDIAVGTFEGYIAKLINTGDGYSFEGYFEDTALNYKGNSRLLFRNNCVPFFADVNRDGSPDLIVGQQEVGLAYPIDSPYFQYPEAVSRLVEYLRENRLYLGVHYMTHGYASREYELEELERHMSAMESFGADLSFVGANHHTWASSLLGPVQSYLVQYESGILWNSGARTPGNSRIGTPETALSYPYFLISGDDKTILLLNIPTLLVDSSTVLTSISGRNEMPVCIYYHCDLIYKEYEKHEQNVKTVSDFVQTHRYNFVTEPQLVKTVAAAYSTSVSAKAGSTKTFNTTFTAVNGPSGKLSDERYDACTGLKLTFSDSIDLDNITTDADVYCRMNGSLYIGLNKSVKVSAAKKPQTEAHISRINLPADIGKTRSGAVVSFLDGGMMQLVVEGGEPRTDTEGWTVSQTAEGTVFTRYGDPASIELHW